MKSLLLLTALLALVALSTPAQAGGAAVCTGVVCVYSDPVALSKYAADTAAQNAGGVTVIVQGQVDTVGGHYTAAAGAQVAASSSSVSAFLQATTGLDGPCTINVRYNGYTACDAATLDGYAIGEMAGYHQDGKNLYQLATGT